MTTRTPDEIAAAITAWDTRDVRELRELLAELSACRTNNGDPIDTQHYVDMTSLPSAEIPDDVDTSYPVWAVDKSGNALVGDDATAIEPLDALRPRGE